MREIVICFGAIVMLLSTGCASIFTGAKQEVHFESEPTGATIVVAGKTIGTTPVSAQLDKEDDQILLVTKEGYAPYMAPMSTKISPWFWGNIIIGGGLGSATDGVTGNVRQFEPDTYFVTLDPKQPLSASASSQRDLKLLIVSSGDNFRKEAVQGEGETLAAVLQHLRITQPNDVESAKQRMKKLCFQTENDLELSERLIEIYLD